MFASNLAQILSRLLEHSDSGSSFSETTRRFESLRGSGRLPTGRVNRSSRLTTTQIAHVVLGMVPTSHAWAGHSSIVLGNLRPVGGETASFLGAPTLEAAITALCTLESARAQFMTLTLSMAETDFNSSGFGHIIFRNGESIQNGWFVSPLATSLFALGSEKAFNPVDRLDSSARQLVLTRKFFDILAAQIETSARWTEPAGDSSEYDDDDARQARFAALGVTNQSQFLNIGVNTQTTWPKRETTVEFDQYKLILMPKTANSTQSIHIDLHRNHISHADAMTIVNRFLSVMSWCSDQFAIAEGGWSGNPIPVPVPRRDLAFATASYWIFDRRIADDEKSRRGIGFYREGLNAEEASLISYAVISYMKIIELKYSDSDRARNWISENIHFVLTSQQSDHTSIQFCAESNGEEPADYLWTACRTAVAHGNPRRKTSDPDDAAEARRLQVASGIMRRLARRFIQDELGISNSPFSGT